MPRKKRVYDENGKVVPTIKDLGITPQIEQSKMEMGRELYQEWYEKKVEAWQLVNEPKIQQEKMAKAAKEKLKEVNHWYNEMPKAKVRSLILSAASKKDVVFEVFLTKIKMTSPLYMYYLNLISRIEEENLDTPTIEYSKLTRFHKYSRKDDKLIGSSHAFVAMFTSCFPPNRKSSKSLML